MVVKPLQPTKEDSWVVSVKLGDEVISTFT
jgi:hypothetical protein